MKYNQPFGISDPNAPYINGNPSTGTMGSIPPAWSIEHDQREIVAVIQYAADRGLIDFNNQTCLPPASTDLTQLLKAIFGLSNRQRVTVPFTFYVNGTTGNDLNLGTTPATAFKTIQGAVNAAGQYSPGPIPITIKIAIGNYNGFTLPFYSIPPIYMEGDTGTPTGVVINGNVSPNSEWAAACGSYNTLYLSYMKLQATGNRLIGPGSSGVVAFNYATVNLMAGLTFGQCDLALISSAGRVGVASPFHMNGTSCQTVLAAQGGTIIIGYLNQGLEIFIDAPMACGAFAAAVGTGSQIGSWGTTWYGRAGVTGYNYNVNWGGFIDSNLAGDYYFPGTLGGFSANGGSYR